MLVYAKIPERENLRSNCSKKWVKIMRNSVWRISDFQSLMRSISINATGSFLPEIFKMTCLALPDNFQKRKQS